MYLVGDIGGTKVHLAYFEKDRLVKEEKFLSRQFGNFNEILKKFSDQPVEKGCFAIAGPTDGRTCRMTNLKWDIDAAQLEKEFRISNIKLVNDLVASGWGLKRLQPSDFFTLNEGAKKSGNQAILAAGTGLGIGGVCWDGKEMIPFASEGGHADFAPHGIPERQLWDYLHKKYGHVSIERVVSGQGLEHLYWFLVEKGKIKKVFEDEEIPQQIIEKGSSDILEWFASLYGTVAGNIALQFLSEGGVYLAGGISPKILPVLNKGGFMKAFVDKGRFQELLQKIPVHVVLNQSLPLLGALELCKAD